MGITGRGFGLVLGLGLSFSLGASESRAQVRERDVTITGPGGRSVERTIRSERGPGFVDRHMEIRRPEGTFERDVRIQRAPGGFVPAHYRGGPGFGGGWGGPGPRTFIERDVIVQNRGVPWGAALAVGGGLFGLGMLTGSALSAPPPPPPVYYAPAPVYVAPAPPPVVVYNPPQPYSPTPPPPATVVVDPVVQAIGRLSSLHDHSRRDGAYTLGRLRDPRAVPALVDRLKNDWAKEVRVAAATALGEIGDPRGAVALERASVYDKKEDVRNAAASALSRIQALNAAPAAGQATGTAAPSSAVPTAATVPNLDAIERVPPPPRPASSPYAR